MTAPDTSQAIAMNFKVSEWLTPLAVIALTLLLNFKLPSPGPAPDPTPAPAPAPAPVPAPVSPLTAAAQAYYRDFPATLADLAQQVRAGQVRDKASAVAYTKSRSQAFTTALDQLFTANCDGTGAITNPGAIADALNQAGGGLR